MYDRCRILGAVVLAAVLIGTAVAPAGALAAEAPAPSADVDATGASLPDGSTLVNENGSDGSGERAAVENSAVDGDRDGGHGKPSAREAANSRAATESIGRVSNADHVGAAGVEAIDSGSDAAASTNGPTYANGDLVRYPSDVPDADSLGTVVDQVGANGTVVVENGTYTVEPNEDNPENATMVLEDGVSVRAADGATPVIRIEDARNESVGIQLAGDSATLSGVEVRGDGVDQLVSSTADRTEVRNLTLRDARVGVDVASGDGATIIDNDVRDVEVGIEVVRDASFDAIRGNHVVNATGYGIYAWGAGGTVTGNEIELLRGAENGILTYGVDGISNNVINASGDSQTLIAMLGNATGAAVGDNELRGGRLGVFLSAEGPVTVVDNEIAGMEKGIAVNTGSPDGSESHLLTRNHVNTTRVGIDFQNGQGTVVRDNQLRTGERAGIEVAHVSDITITDNHVHGERTGDTIRLWDATDIRLTGNVVSGNTLAVWDSNNVSVADTTISDAHVGIEIRGPEYVNSSPGSSRNVTVSGTTTIDVDYPIEVRERSHDVEVEDPNATAAFRDHNAGVVEDLTLADGTTIDANATDASIGLAEDPGSVPANRTQIGPTFEFESRWVDGSIGRLAVDAPADVLDGVEDGSIDLVAYDGGNWTVVANATVESGSVAVTNVSTFGRVAFLGTPDESDDDGDGGDGGPVFVPAPPSGDGGGASPSFTLTSVELGAAEVQVGESVAVDVRVDNDGDADGEYAGTLTVDGEPVDNATVAVNSNWHETVTLETTFGEPGTYDLAVDGQSAGTVAVQGVPDLAVANATVDETTVEPGETVAVTATVENDGSVEGSTTVPFAVDGDRTGNATVTVPANGTETVTVEHTFETTGSHQISLDGEQVGTVTVEASGGDSLPGFGAIVAIVGLLGGVALARRL